MGWCAMCNSFMFHEKFGEMLRSIDDKAERDALIIAMVYYGAYDEEAKLDKPFLQTLFNLVKHDIDYSVQNSKNGKKGRRKRDEAKGTSPLGKPPKVAPSESPSDKPTEDRPPPLAKYVSKKVSKYVGKKEENTRERRRRSPTEGEPFRPPSLEEAQAFCVDEYLEYIDAERLWSYYESQGWVKSHGPKITDWQTAFREANERESQS